MGRGFRMGVAQLLSSRMKIQSWVFVLFPPGRSKTRGVLQTLASRVWYFHLALGRPVHLLQFDPEFDRHMLFF